MEKSPLLNFNLLLLSLNPAEFTVLSVILGYVFCNGLTANQAQSMGNFFEELGQTMITIGSQMETLDDNTIDTNQNQDLINSLKNKIGNIEKIIADLKNMNIKL